MPPTMAAYAYLIATMLCWAGNAIAGQFAVGHVSPLMLVMLRWLLVSSCLAVIYRRELVETWPIVRSARLRMLVMAIIGFTAFNSLFYIAAHHTTGINIGILQGSIPVIVLILSVFAWKSRIGPLQLAGVTVTLIGVVTVASQGDLGRLLRLEFNPGDAIMLLACLLYASYTVGLKLRPPMPGLVFLAWLSIIAALTSIPLAAFEWLRGDLLQPTGQGWVVTIWISIFPSFLAQIFFIRGVELIGPERAGVFVNLVPIFAAFLAVLMLSENFEVYHAISLTLVLGGIALSEKGKPA
ncbi:MAG: DMT family transporter [Geminicoccaceae bacterium]